MSTLHVKCAEFGGCGNEYTIGLRAQIIPASICCPFCSVTIHPDRWSVVDFRDDAFRGYWEKYADADARRGLVGKDAPFMPPEFSQRAAVAAVSSVIDSADPLEELLNDVVKSIERLRETVDAVGVAGVDGLETLALSVLVAHSRHPARAVHIHNDDVQTLNRIADIIRHRKQDRAFSRDNT